MKAALPQHLESPSLEPDCRRGELWFDHDLVLDDGTRLAQARLAWQLHGPAHAPVVLVLGGISAHRNATGAGGETAWWSEQCGPGLPLDPSRLRILGIDWIGGSHESTGPAENADFPSISTRDQARAIVALLDRLGITRLPLLVGASYGGCVAQHLAALLGQRLSRLVILAAAHRPSNYAVGLRHVQREVLKLGIARGHGRDSLAIARSLAMLTYRSADEFEERFADGSAAVDYLRAQGERFRRRYDPVAAERLAASLDAHWFEPESLCQPTRIVAFDSDILVPLALLREFAARAPRAALTVIGTRYGHDGFLKEARAVAAVLRTELAQEGLR